VEISPRPLALLCAGLAVILCLRVPVSTQGRPATARALKTVIVNGREAVSGEVLVKFRGAQAPASRAQAVQQADADADEAVGGSGVRRLHSRRLDTAALLALLLKHPDVEYVEPNYIVRALDSEGDVGVQALTPNDPAFPVLWGLQNTGQIISVSGTVGADIGAASAWTISTGSRANVVAVIDSGIDYMHPDLSANVWSAPIAFSVTIGGIPVNCAAGTHGFNAITRACDPMDDFGHGTHVSGTVGAVGNNGIGVVGVNWKASVMGIKFLDSSGNGTTSDAINAIEFAIQAKSAFASSGRANVRVLSNSWGGSGFSQALLDEINKANTNDMLFVAAAGNTGTNNDTAPFYPASFDAPNVMAVAATDNNDHLASFSNYGQSSVHLGAPGVLVYSTYPGNSYQYESGTSMATPHVSGAAALVLSRCSLTTAGLKNTLTASVDPLPSLSGLTVTGGRLNVNKAIRACTTLSDFNGDGRSDLVFRNYTTGANDVWFMNGSTVLGSVPLPGVSDVSWQIVGVGDFNADGWPDLVWRHAVVGLDYLWYMNGSTVIGAAWLPTVSDANWEIAGVGDFNADGRPDLVWRHKVAGANYVWYMNGATVIGTTWLPGVSDANWEIGGVGDFNGDGKPDLLWRHKVAGVNYLWYMSGATMIDAIWLPGVSDTNWQIGAVGDFNADGDPDLAWRHKVAGANYVWYMNGAATSGQAWLPGLPDTNWAILRWRW
jgi:subtilisin family serine protease